MDTDNTKIGLDDPDFATYNTPVIYETIFIDLNYEIKQKVVFSKNAFRPLIKLIGITNALNE